MPRLTRHFGLLFDAACGRTLRPRSDDRRLATLVLGGPLPRCAQRLLEASELVGAADGGANGLMQFRAPDVLAGDMDSIKPEILAALDASLMTTVVRDADVHCDDFEKALRALDAVAEEKGGLWDVAVLGSLGGNVTQELGNVNGLFRHLDSSRFRLSLVSDDNVVSLLGAGSYRLLVNASTTVYCGLIPIGGPIPGIVTKGLRWDLDGETELSFGGMVSTSNEFSDGQIEIDTPKPLIFTLDTRGRSGAA